MAENLNNLLQSYDRRIRNLETTKVVVSTGVSPSYRNVLMNGAMAIDQRNTGASQTFTAAAVLAYSVDRWYGFCTGANITGARVAGTAPNQYNYRFTGAASNTTVGFGQRIEAANSFHLAGQTATLSVSLASTSLTSVTWSAYYANTADTFGTLASPTRTSIATGTFTVTSTLDRKTANITIPSAATTGIEIVFTGGALLGSQTLTFSDAQLELGSAATPFERRPIGMELALCQRYYYRTAQNTIGWFGQGQCYSATLAYIQIQFPTIMRIDPNVIETSGVAGHFSLNTATSTLLTCSVVPSHTSHTRKEQAVVDFRVASGLVAGNITGARSSNAAAYLAWSAEL